jgi:hypothetical protein
MTVNQRRIKRMKRKLRTFVREAKLENKQKANALKNNK